MANLDDMQLAFENGFGADPPATVWRVASVQTRQGDPPREIHVTNWFCREGDATAHVERLRGQGDAVVSCSRYELVKEKARETDD